MIFLLKIAAIPILFGLPGYSFCRLMIRRRTPLFWLMSIAFSIPFISVAGFALARFGFFSLTLLTAAAIFISIVLLFIRPAGADESIDDPSDVRKDSAFTLALVAICAAFFFYYSPPFEYYFGGRDPGIYVVNGIRIARTGSFTAEDPLMKSIPDEYRNLFFSGKDPVRYMGFRVDDQSRIVPNFFYLYPVWLAIFYSMFGVHGMLYATPFLAIALLIAAALLAKLLLGRVDAITAVLVLGSSAISLWFARFPNSEVLAGTLIFLALFAYRLYDTKANLAAGIAGSFCLALAFWTRIDAILLAIPLVIFLGIRWMERRSSYHDAIVAGIYIVFILLGGWHVLTTNSDYLLAAFANLKFKPSKVVLVLSAALAATMALLYMGRRFRIADKPVAGKAIAIAVGIVAVYAYFIRPYYPPSNIGSPNAGALIALSWYFTHPLIVLALAGLVLYPLRLRSVHWILFAGTAVYAALYFYRIRGHAEHFWMLRRYLMLICPALVIFAVYGAKELLSRITRLKERASVIVFAASLILTGWIIYQNREIQKHSEFKGSFEWLQKLSTMIGPKDLLLIGAKEANDLHIIGPMLSYYFDKNVLVLRTARPKIDLFSSFLKSWNGNVYFAGAGNSNLASSEFYLKPLKEVRFETPVYDEIYHRRPKVAFKKYFQVGWYQVQRDRPAKPYFVDIGKFDDGNITNFHLKENYTGVDYRWTNGNGHVFFPPSNTAATGVVLRMNPGPWVPGMERVHVKLYLNELPVVDLVLRSGYKTYDVPIPAVIREKISGVPIDLRIESRSWIPKRVLNLPDVRRVGVIVDWVELRF